MLRAFVLAVTVGFSCLALAQTFNTNIAPASPPSSTVQVVYAIDGSTLTSYDVDPQTLQATQVGTVTLEQSIYPGLTASRNGQFLYITAYENISQQGLRLYVYDTDADGLPGPSPVQQIAATQLSGLAVDPSGKFLYSVAVGPTSQQHLTTQYSIVRNSINATNGKLSDPVIEETYTLDSNVSGNDCYLAILGFNPAGTTMYDAIFCSGPHASGSNTYNQRSVDLQTGGLGPDEEVYSYSYYAGSGYANVQFEGDHLFAFIMNSNQGPNANLVDIYPTSNTSTPLISCDYSMLAACGDFIQALANPTGKFVSLTTSQVSSEIGKVDLSTNEIVSTSSIPYEVQQFSPNGKIAYAVNDVNNALEIEIYGLNLSSGAVTQGGTISLPSDADSWFAAERN